MKDTFLRLRMTGDSSDLRREMDRAGRSVDRSGRRMRDSMGGANRSMQSAAASGRRLMGILSGIASVGVMGAMIKRAIDTGDAVQKMAIRTGASTEALSQLAHAAELSGTSIEVVGKAIQVMQRNAVEAARGTKLQADAFAELGIDVGRFLELKPEDQLEVMADALARVESEERRTALAMDTLGRSGTALLPLLAGGSAALRDMRHEADDLGKTLTRAAADDMAKANDALTRLKAAVAGLGQQLAIVVAGPLADFLGGLRPLVKFFGEDLAAGFGDLAADDVVRMENRAEEIRKVLKGGLLAQGERLRFFGKDGLVEYYDDAELKAELSKLDAQIEAFYSRSNRPAAPARDLGALGDPAAPGDAKANAEAEAAAKRAAAEAERQRTAQQQAIADLERRKLAVNALTEEEKILYELRAGRFAAFDDQTKARLVDLARELDLAAALAKEEAETAALTKAIGQEAARLVDATRTPIEQFNAEIARLNELLAQGEINIETFNRAAEQANERVLEQIAKGKEAADETSQFAIQAARNMESALADFLFDPFDKGLDGMLLGFVDTIRRMLAEALAAQLAKALFGDIGKTGEIGGLAKSLILHDGGIVGAGGPTRQVSALAFAGAPRYHVGGIAGLKPGEMPAVLQAGEEVLKRSDPRHAANGGGSMAIRNIIVDDRASVGDYLASAAGEKVVLQVLRRNAMSVKSIIS
jgi:hypothetical protein